MIRRIRSSFGLQLTTLTLIAVLLPLALAGIVINRTAVTNLEANVYKEIANRSGSLQQTVNLWDNAVTLALKNMSGQPDVVSMDSARQRPVLVQMVNVYDYMYLTLALDPSGTDTARSDDSISINYEDRFWFQQAAAGSPITREAVVSRSTGRPVVGFSAPILGDAGAVLGVAFVGTELTELAEQVGATQIGETGFVYLVDEMGRVLAHPDLSVEANELIDLSEYPPVARLLAGESGPFTFVDDAGIAWLAHLDRAGNGWGIVVQQQEREAFAVARAFAVNSVLVGLFVILLISAMIWFVSSRAIRPIQRLTNAATDLAAGNWQQTISVSREDEIGVLANAFSSMSAQLRALVDSLEQRVANRTRDLMTSAEISQELSTILDQEHLVTEVAQRIRDAFDYYHINIYLLDEETETLHMVGGTGQPGQMMLAAGHTLALGQGLVGRAAATNTAVLIPDVTQEPQWLPNSLLPETRAETAVPISLGQRVLGVIDVQHHVTGGLSVESVDLLQTIANQVAIALQNTRQLAEIEANNQRLDLVVRSANDGIWDWDIANDETYFSPRWKAILGYADDELPSEQTEFASRLHPDDRDPILQAMTDYLAGGAPDYEHEFRMQHKDGSYRWILARAFVVRDEAGNPLRVTGSHSDITARKEAEAHILEEQALLRSVVDSSIDWICIKDREHRFLLVNRAFADSFDLTPEEMLGKNDLEIGFPETYVLGDPEQGIRGFWADDDEVIASGETKYIAEEMAVVKGETRILNTIKLPLRNLEGEVTSILMFVRDITELKWAEASIRQEQARTEEILEALNVPIVISRLNDGTVAYVNEPMADLIRASRDTLVGTATPDFYQDLADRQQYIASLRQEGQVTSFEIGLKRIDGEPFWGLLSGRIIEFQGEPAIITSVIDVTTRRRAQDALALRARELQTVAQVGAAAATTLEPARLLQQVVELTKTQFDLYHAHIYLLNEAENSLTLHTGSGEVGRQMVAEGRLIPFDQAQSLVARAARTRQGIVVNDILAEPGFLPHPLLPETRAELAVPLVVGEQVLGVLDVQAVEAGRFNEEEVSIFSTLATQIAVALQNARRYDEAQRALDELTRIQRVLVREGWQAFLLAQERPLQGFHFDQKVIRPIASKEETAVVEPEFTLPLAVRGQMVGKLGVRNPSGAPLSENQRQLLANLTGQVAEALERTRLTEQTQIALTETETRSQELALLNEMAQTLTAQTSVDGVLNVIYDYTSRLVSSEEFYVAFYNAQNDEVEFALTVAGDQKRRNFGRRRSGQGLTEHLLKLKRPLLIRENVDQYLGEVGIAAIGRTAESWMGVPLLYGDTTLGVISLQSYSTPRAYNDQHLRLLATIANQAAIAIENARLIEATTKRARQEQLLREVSARVNAAVDAESVLKTATREIGRALGLETFIYLKNQQDRSNGRSTDDTAHPAQAEPETANGAAE